MGGMLGWSLATLPALHAGTGPSLAAVDHPALPPAHSFRAHSTAQAHDLRTHGGASAFHLLPPSGPEAPTGAGRLIVPPDPALASPIFAAGALPYFPTGPPSAA